MPISATMGFTAIEPEPSCAYVALADQPATAAVRSEHATANATPTLTRRKHPQAFETAAKLRETVDLKHFRDKKPRGPSVNSVEEFVVIHKAAEAQIRELKREKAKDYQTISNLQAENAKLQQQSDDLERVLNRRIADQDRVVGASGGEASRGLLRDYASKVSTLEQELTNTKAAADAAVKKVWRGAEIMRQQRDTATQALKDAKKENLNLEKQPKAQPKAKTTPQANRASTRASASMAKDGGEVEADVESMSDGKSALRPRSSTRSFRKSASAHNYDVSGGRECRTE